LNPRRTEDFDGRGTIVIDSLQSDTRRPALARTPVGDVDACRRPAQGSPHSVDQDKDGQVFVGDQLVQRYDPASWAQRNGR
jgi:hypothetical protein